ncbi:MAG: class I SAM-dependent methyltransferase family protein [Nanoarchaeota archaeon]|nr:class I SAM-dependent methyltransferase family protein [Nanoarchaeota archaeon]MBU1135342.1 class I SAM-dependent methyltransferase family protein [Nanoarchaeota archaeon]MBU2519706.1 class I SAM-dependent methyltransferase family protein [Nanoarchaeota archaeon]
MKLKDLLSEKLTKKEMEFLRTSFDIVGDIAIIEIPDELEKKEKDIAKAIVSMHPNIKTVCKKTSDRSGEFRLKEMKLILGNNSETIHTEHGCKYKIDVKKVYFSPRESTERQRISSQVKDGEKIMIMFSGVCPYAIAIAKQHPDINIYAVEKNPDGHKYAEENVKLNRVRAVVTPILGDVKKECPPYFDECDRVAMPLPKSAYEFLDIAIKCLKDKGGIIHFYHRAPEDNLFDEAVNLLKNAAKKEKRKIKILNKQRVLPYGPRMYKVCIDAKVWK